jgi:hypothetical protein
MSREEADARARGPGRREVHRPAEQHSRKKYYQFTAIDDCTRLRVLRIYNRLNQKTAIQFADFLLEKFRSGSRRSRQITGSSFSRQGAALKLMN